MNVRLPSTTWLAATIQTHGPGAEPGQEPTPGGFDWDKVRPDPDAVPRSDLFYELLRGLMFLGVAAVIAGLVAGAVAFTVGPIFGAHYVSDRGKAMMWKAGLTSIVLGSATAIVSFLMSR